MQRVQRDQRVLAAVGVEYVRDDGGWFVWLCGRWSVVGMNLRLGYDLRAAKTRYKVLALVLKK